jgi:hypothetical protein
VHNGGAQDAGRLNEKWESLALVKADENDTYHLFSVSDNDFITQNGFINFGQNQYKDASGFNLDNQVLVFKITLPKEIKAARRLDILLVFRPGDDSCSYWVLGWEECGFYIRLDSYFLAA